MKSLRKYWHVFSFTCKKIERNLLREILINPYYLLNIPMYIILKSSIKRVLSSKKEKNKMHNLKASNNVVYTR